MSHHRKIRLATIAAAALALLGVCASTAFAETRTLKIYQLHTREKVEIAYKRNGRYLPDGLKKINHVLRDWRRNEPIKMDPRLLDLVWEAYRASGSNGYINVVSAYRAPATNAMLRGRSKGVAKNSQHTLGKAMDFFIPGVPLKKLRDIGLKMQGGGVGYYPSSGSPFIHMDVGNVRHWPRISRQELVSVFPNGKTLHVPSDGKPLPGYEQAVAAYKARKDSGSVAIALASTGGSARKSAGLLATLFGGGADEEEDVAEVAKATPAARSAAPAPTPAPAAPSIAIVPPDKAQRMELPVRTEAPEQSGAIVAALPAREVPVPHIAPRPALALGEGAQAQAAERAAALAMADETQGAAPVMDPFTVEIAQIPLPTWRPEQTVALAEAQPNAAGGPSSAPVPTLLALAAADDGTSRPTPLQAPAPAEVAMIAPQEAPLPDPRNQHAAPQTSGADEIRTSPKQARPGAQDRKADPRVVPVPAAMAEVWPLRASYGSVQVASAATTPRLATNFIRTAPVEIYAEGFQRDRPASDHRRFTGSAVTFLPVARFK